MEQLSSVAKPGLMISQTWPNSREREGDTLQAIETALAENYFEALQTIAIPYPAERKQIAKIIAGQQMPLTYTLTRVLNENHLNLSDLNESNRKKSYETVITCLDDAFEAGATTVGIISGPAPANAALRPEALRKLADSMLRICSAAQAHHALKILIEPLDFAVHKKNALGTTEEAVTLCQWLNENGVELNLCLDTAHILLNQEEPLKTLALAQPYLLEYHYCNCVTDPSHPLFGDHHIPFGPPGRLDVAGIAAIMETSMKLGFFNPTLRPSIFCEVLKRSQDDSIELMRNCRTIMEQAWSASGCGHT